MDLQLPQPLQLALPFFHPLLMFGALGLSLYALYLGIQSRRLRSASAEERKDLIKGKFAQKHFIVGSLFLVLMVFGALGGMAVTYITNGKLFVGPHLLAGLGLTGLVALSAALAPIMKDGQKAWARNLHILLNVVTVGILGWQAATGVQIVLRIVGQMRQQLT
ncbi:MAG: DUF4079 domain-containing protein [Cyanobacteriota bacterium]|nr:DUF4079 domain-containing protein [Cyanobacteriota bacterium]